MIKKGGLTFLENKTISGHLITIISEDRQVCTPTQADHTGVYLKGRLNFFLREKIFLNNFLKIFKG